MQVNYVKHTRGKWRVVRRQFTEEEQDMAALAYFAKLVADPTVDFVTMVCDKEDTGYDDPMELARHLQDLDDLDIVSWATEHA